MVNGEFSTVHGIALDADDGRKLAENSASLIWSPRSNMSLYGNTAPVSMLKDQGVLMALGTDWTPSGSMNLARELACANQLNSTYFDHAFSDRELWLMVTYNPVRPMDGGMQADSDGDGRGDMCDKCPLDTAAECSAVDPYTGEIVYISDGD
jgi:cytosine/adenosine deaminase-related metal-dependent hydrolase